MSETHPNHGQQNPAAILPRAHRVKEDAERRSRMPESKVGPHAEVRRHRSWEIFLIWAFVSFMFAAFFFCFLTISAKCRGGRPF